ncbi:MAG: tRNA (cytidine(34)-2'-O)-methyltransferase [Chlamydiales bacterium]|nr:tRNA (cytidine(34)-2'-O)-methyltransferase [Chlamydiales bacterium]
MEVVLFQPEIPQNAGNIARTCAVTGTKLILIRPLGFSLSSRHLKRAGLDYWNDLDFRILDTLEPAQPCYFFSTKATRPYTEIRFESNAQLIFGSESAGLPPAFHEGWGDAFYTIPMLPGARSLNLSNSVAIVLYEALRQGLFKGLR